MILSFHSTLVTPGTAPFRCGWVPGTLSGRGRGRPGHGKWPLTWLLPCPAHSQGHGTQPFCPQPRLGQKLCRAPGPATGAGRHPLPRPAASTTLMGHRSGVGERGATRHSGPPPSPHPRCPVLCTAADGPSPSTPNVQWVWAPRPAAGRGRGNAPPSAGAPCGPQEPLQSRPAPCTEMPDGPQRAPRPEKDSLHISGHPLQKSLEPTSHAFPFLFRSPFVGRAVPPLPGAPPAAARAAVAAGSVGVVGVVGVGAGKRADSGILREVLQEDRRLQLLHLYLRKLEGPLAGHGGRQGVGPFQEVVHSAKQASRPLGTRRGQWLSAGVGGDCALGPRCWEQATEGQSGPDRAGEPEKQPPPQRVLIAGADGTDPRHSKEMRTSRPAEWRAWAGGAQSHLQRELARWHWTPQVLYLGRISPGTTQEGLTRRSLGPAGSTVWGEAQATASG